MPRSGDCSWANVGPFGSGVGQKWRSMLDTRFILATWMQRKPLIDPNCIQIASKRQTLRITTNYLLNYLFFWTSTYHRRLGKEIWIDSFLPQKVNLGVGVLLDHPRNPSNLTLQNSTSPQIGQKYQTIPNWPKFTQTVWRNQAMRT